MSKLLTKTMKRVSKAAIIVLASVIGMLAGCPRELSAKCLIPEASMLANIKTIMGSALRADTCEVELNNRYIFEFDFVNRKRIGSIKVHSLDAKSNFINSGEFQVLMHKLDSIQNIGGETKKGNYGVFTNQRTYVTSLYEKAFVNSSESPVFDEKGHSTDRIIYFCVFYLKTIKGRIQEKKQLPRIFADGTDLYRLKVDDTWYLTTSDEFDRANPKVFTHVTVAGPLDCPD